VTLYAWVDSFTLLALRYGETVKKITNIRQININRTVSKHITDDEKLIISTINPAYSAIVMDSAQYIFTELIKLLAQNATSFTKRYVPTEHPRISKYLHTRSLKYRHVMEIMTQGSKGKGKGKPIKKQKVQDVTQRACVYVTESVAPGLSAPPPFQKGKNIMTEKGNPRWVPREKEKANLHPQKAREAKASRRELRASGHPKVNR
jgi:hypothetical protein